MLPKEFLEFGAEILVSRSQEFSECVIMVRINGNEFHSKTLPDHIAYEDKLREFIDSFVEEVVSKPLVNLQDLNFGE